MRSTLATTRCRCWDPPGRVSLRNHVCKEHAGQGSVRRDLEMEGDGDARTAPSVVWETGGFPDPEISRNSRPDARPGRPGVAHFLKLLHMPFPEDTLCAQHLCAWQPRRPSVTSPGPPATRRAARTALEPLLRRRQATGTRLCMPGEPPATTANGPQAPLLSPDGVAAGWTGCPGCGFTPGQSQPVELPLPDPNQAARRLGRRRQLAGSAPTPATRAEGSPSPHRPRHGPGQAGCSRPHGPSACAQSPDAQMRGESHAVTRPLRALECTNSTCVHCLQVSTPILLVLPFKFTCTCILRALIIVKYLKTWEKISHLTWLLPYRPGTQPPPPRGPAAPAPKAARRPVAWLVSFPTQPRGCRASTSRGATQHASAGGVHCDRARGPCAGLRSAFLSTSLAHGQGADQGRGPEADSLIHLIQ